MTDLTNVITNTISISLFNRGLAGKVFEEVKRSGAKVVIKNNFPECVLLSPEEYVKLMNEVNDAHLLALANERMENFNKSKVLSEEEVLKGLEITADELADNSEVEFE